MLVMVPSLYATRRSFQWWLGGGMAALATVNLLIVGANVGWRQLTYARDMQKTLREMSAAAQPVHVYLGSFQSLRQRLREADVDFQKVETPSETEPRRAIPSPGHEAFWLESRQQPVR
jgi:hypothetical protein